MRSVRSVKVAVATIKIQVPCNYICSYILRLGRAHHYHQSLHGSLGRECLASEATNRRRAAKKEASLEKHLPPPGYIALLNFIYTCITRLNTRRRLAHRLQMRCVTREYSVHAISRDVKKRGKSPGRKNSREFFSRIFFEVRTLLTNENCENMNCLYIIYKKRG
ncbi:hypothetical protein ALC53_01954 [Atta colombica]|uniref:Uncharacterized protein n=1 Tax=Atta colombica TaxID=520822 RepID=A0A195BRH9_9HYME|nr:hypothetical protein ALC53_01954 [Atta colombica]